MRVFLTQQVMKLVRRERLPDTALCRAASEVLAGKLGGGEADLGGGLFKKRLARAGEGKSGGFRAIIAYRRPHTERVLFSFAFAKNAASTLTSQGHEALSEAAKAFVSASDAQIASLIATGKVSEVDCDGNA
jgi:hypothetical protein